MGHPLGASGTRIIAHLAYELRYLLELLQFRFASFVEIHEFRFSHNNPTFLILLQIPQHCFTPRNKLLGHLFSADLLNNSVDLLAALTVGRVLFLASVTCSLQALGACPLRGRGAHGPIPALPHGSEQTPHGPCILVAAKGVR